MEVNNMDHMYIRHAVGSRLFLDSEKHDANFQIQKQGEVWVFNINVVDENMVEQILQHCNELNIFVTSNSNPKHKSWYYSSAGIVEYDKINSKLVLVADHKLDYTT
jgi:hypothetical protein